MVDLPGFGYAKVSKSEKKEWQKSLNEFITNRSSIRVFILLSDARHPNMKIDQEVREYLHYIKKGDQDILEIFTKADKLNQKEKTKLKREFPNGILISNLKKSGIENANKLIFNLLFQKSCE